jgi:hypothetical protein
VLVFLLFLNAAAAVLVSSGVAADWGVQPNPGGDEELSSANQTAASFEPSGGAFQTLFSMYTSVTDTFSNVIGVATAGPRMFANLGVPGWLTTFLFAPLYILVAIDLVYLLTQRRA